MWRWRRKKEAMTDTNEPSEETVSILADLTECPHCNANLIGEPIEPSRRDMFGNRTHYSLLIGMSNGDSIQYYKCWHCHQRIERTGGPSTGFRTCDVEVGR